MGHAFLRKGPRPRKLVVTNCHGALSTGDVGCPPVEPNPQVLRGWLSLFCTGRGHGQRGVAKGKRILSFASPRRQALSRACLGFLPSYPEESYRSRPRRDSNPVLPRGQRLAPLMGDQPADPIDVLRQEIASLRAQLGAAAPDPAAVGGLPSWRGSTVFVLAIPGT